MRSPFDVLQIDPDADDEAVEQAYRRRVKEAHPDHGGSASEFRAVRAAYERIQAGYESDDRGGDAAVRDHVDARREHPGAGETAAERHGGSGTRVEYLDYEVLHERGWSLADDDLFEKAAAADLGPLDHGRFEVEPDESLLEAAEKRGFAWPFACRGGACANCAVAVFEGELSMPVDHVLSDGWMDRGIRLSCNGVPVTDEMQVVYNVKHLPGLDELRLPPHPFEQASRGD